MDGTTTEQVAEGLESSNGNATLETARLRFRAFFEELRGRFLEREETLEQIALALLAKEHVLLTGPPGTAKSAISRAVLQNVVDRETGLPSVFSRQFTESTVQTDLIGPLDFKTLMASGRSEHFTDEGMLGAVHAFLDEVLDGRDMLLRTTLNVLHERELKQGTKTTTGAIECALMTSNRYLFEVLEQSRETLLAFVDRIAFISFVPKGFADPENLVSVLKGQFGPKTQAVMPKLTIQDIDVLQDVVSYVRISEPMLGELVAMLGRLEAELVAATRADPRFVPTRYLSTRTAVRTARILCAGVVYDWIMNQPTRSLNVRATDFGRLRSTLLLSGPRAGALEKALQNEVDPREARQLSICQTEAHLFERVLAGVTEQAPPPVPERETELPTLAEVRGMRLDVQVGTCQELAKRAESGGLKAIQAQHRLQEVVELLHHELLSHCLGAGIVDHGRGQTWESLRQLAELLDTTHETTRLFAPMLRTRALELIEARVVAAPVTSVTLVRAVRQGAFEFGGAKARAKAQLDHFEGMLAARARLLAGGAVPRPNSTQLWNDYAKSTLEEVVKIWELALDGFLVSAKDGPAPNLDSLLGALRGPVSEMNASGRAFVGFGHDSSCVASRVLSSKLMPHIAAALDAEKPATRQAVSAIVESLLDRLQEANALYVISSAALTRWVASALLAVQSVAHVPNEPEVPLHIEGYRQLRDRQASSSLCHALVAACTYIAQYSPELRSTQAPSIALVQAQLAVLEDQTVAEICQADERRIRTALQFFERWWQDLTPGSRSSRVQLDFIMSSRFYELLENEAVLVRFTLEAELIGVLFPSRVNLSRSIAADVAEFRLRVQNHVHRLMHEQEMSNRREALGRE